MKVAIVHNKEAKTIEVTERLNALLEARIGHLSRRRRHIIVGVPSLQSLSE